jgi:hypothetical protein
VKRASPETITAIGGYGFQAYASKSAVADLDAHPGMTADVLPGLDAARNYEVGIIGRFPMVFFSH